MIRTLFLFMFLFLSSFCLADQITLTWQAPELREDGEQITGNLTYEVLQNGQAVYRGPEKKFTATVNRGAPHWFSVSSLENGLKSTPIYKRIYIEQSPPGPPAWVDAPGSSQ